MSKCMRYAQSVVEIDFDRLLDEGKRVFLFDFDNTINIWRSEHIPEDIVKIFEYLKSKGASIYIVSNGKKRSLDYSVPVIWRALKPLTFKTKATLGKELKDRSKVVVIGDQIFTDVLFGKFLGVCVVKVEPLDKSREFLGTKILRFFERILKKLL
ncbi:MAG: YqeG family HAD IIIA-type phosphatase [Fervidobacterium sp.]|uniref:YqeG family HAD IIIA-type phosphatase n=1 Tax=Fervidobacterium sp. TaxID=1871331 RepID=UPI0040493F66